MQRLTVLASLILLSTRSRATHAQAQAGAGDVVRLEASPPSVVVMMGEEVPFEVRALDAGGRVVADAQVRTAAPRAAATVRGGTVRGRAAGEYEIVVTLLTPPGFEGTPPSLRVPLTVLAPEVATVEVVAEPGRLYQGTPSATPPPPGTPTDRCGRARSCHGRVPIRPSPPSTASAT